MLGRGGPLSLQELCFQYWSRAIAKHTGFRGFLWVGSSCWEEVAFFHCNSATAHTRAWTQPGTATFDLTALDPLAKGAAISDMWIQTTVRDNMHVGSRIHYVSWHPSTAWVASLKAALVKLIHRIDHMQCILPKWHCWVKLLSLVHLVGCWPVQFHRFSCDTSHRFQSGKLDPRMLVSSFASSTETHSQRYCLTFQHPLHDSRLSEHQYSLWRWLAGLQCFVFDCTRASSLV